MFDLRLLKIRSFSTGATAALLASISRGGLQFMLIIWLQGIGLVLHGYSFIDTPLWSGIYLLPLTGGFLLAGPLSGWLSDRYGARLFASGGLLLSAAAFGGLMLLPTDFNYGAFAVLIFLSGAGMGLFSAPNAAAVMNSVPPRQRGAASGMLATFTNSGFVLSIGIFFSLMIAGLASTLPTTLTRGLAHQGVPSAIAHQIGSLPPVGSLFAAFLGYNPVHQLLAPTGVLNHLPAKNVATLTGKQFFPQLISGPFHHGLVIVFSMAVAVLVIAAIAALRHGGKELVHERAAENARAETALAEATQAEATRAESARAESTRAASANGKPGNVQVANGQPADGQTGNGQTSTSWATGPDSSRPQTAKRP
jgi:MFS family permease